MAEQYYRIKGSTLTGMADAIRAKTGSSAGLVPEQMGAEIEEIASTETMIDAETTAFGISETTKEYGYVAHGSSITGARTSESLGYRFTVGTQALNLIGFRVHGDTFSWIHDVTCALWDADGTLLVSGTYEWEVNNWLEYYFDTPIKLSAGSTYTFGAQGSYSDYFSNDVPVEFNGKLIDVQLLRGSSWPPTANSTYVVQADIIFEDFTEELPTEYKIQRATMDDVAYEVQRISARPAKLNPTGMISALQSVNADPNLQLKTIDPTTEQQTVMPDDGYTGLSAVTVGAIELQEKTVVPSGETQEITPDDGRDGLAKVVVTPVLLQEKVVTPGAAELEISPDEGYSGLGKVTVAATNELFVLSASGEVVDPIEGAASSLLQTTATFSTYAVGHNNATIDARTLESWEYDDRYVEVDNNSIALKTSYVYKGVEDTIDIGALSVVTVPTSDKAETESVVIANEV